MPMREADRPALTGYPTSMMPERSAEPTAHQRCVRGSARGSAAVGVWFCQMHGQRGVASERLGLCTRTTPSDSTAR